MSAFALAHLRNPQLHPDIFEYLERIEATLTPYSGRFIVHGGKSELLEGSWPGAVVAIEFPGMVEAKAWYWSDPYQEILHLRTDHITSDVIIVDGLESDHDSAKLAAKLRDELRLSLSQS